MEEPKKPAEPNIARYDLSIKQNAKVKQHEERIAAAGREVERAAHAFEEARKLAEAKADALSARQAAHQGEIASRTMFLEYIIDEFSLPTPKEGGSLGWTPRETEPGKYALYAEVDEVPDPPAVPPAPAPGRKVPKHQSKRRKGHHPVESVKPPAVQSPKGDTNNPVEPTP